MTRDERAFAIYVSLLVRDPLPAQRFTNVQQRLSELAVLAYTAADAFDGIAADARSEEALATEWDRKLTEPGITEGPIVKKATAQILSSASRPPDLFGER